MKCKYISGIGKIPAVLCMLCVLFMSLTLSITANAKSNAKLKTSAVTAERGDTVAVTFNLEGNPGIWGLKFKAEYDHSALTLVSAVNGSVFEESDIVLPGNLSREQFVFVAASNKLEDITADGTMVTLNFLVENGAEDKSYPITLEVTQAINVASEDVKIGVENGSVTVKVDEPEESEDSEDSEESGIEVMTSAVKSGDKSNPVLWIALIVVVLAGGGACCILHIRRGRRSRRSRRGR